MLPEGRVDRLARRLAEDEPEYVNSEGVDTAFDGLARALGGAFTRRGALTLTGAAVVAGSLLRPARARAQDCGVGFTTCWSGGKRVCGPGDLKCCSNDNCAIACPYPWRVCEAPANCADTAARCRPPYETTRTKFCSQRIPVTNGCVDSGTTLSIRGWCCEPSELCAEEWGTCTCPTRCGSDCCTDDEECVNGTCTKKCPAGWHRDGDRCLCDEGQTCGVKCCPEGSGCRGSTCVKQKEPDKAPSIFDSFKNFFDVANQSSATHGGGPRMQSLFAAQAGGPVGAALLALAAVNAQGVAAGAAFSQRPVDRSFRRRVVATRVRRPRIASGDGLEPRAARALEALLAAEAKGFAHALACATALARARGATRAGDFKAVRRQVLAAAGFAGAAARALRPVPSLRAKALAALQSTGAVEVVATPADVLALQTDVRAGGVPADLKAALGRLGVRGGNLAGVRDALLATSPGGPVLIAPLADPARTQNLKAMRAELARYSRAARRSPLARARGGPRTIRSRATR